MFSQTKSLNVEVQVFPTASYNGKHQVEWSVEALT